MYIAKQVDKLMEIKDNNKLFILVNNKNFSNKTNMDNNNIFNNNSNNTTNHKKSYFKTVNTLNQNIISIENSYNNNLNKNNKSISNEILEENIKIIEKLSKKYSICYEVVSLDNLSIYQDNNSNNIGSNANELKIFLNNSSLK